MAVVRLLAVHLAGPSRQQVLQSPKTVLDPPATLPRPYEPRPADGRVETHHVELLLTRLLDNDDGGALVKRGQSTRPAFGTLGTFGACHVPGPLQTDGLPLCSLAQSVASAMCPSSPRS